MAKANCCWDLDNSARQRNVTYKPKTSDFYRTCNLPERFEYPYWFYGYGVQRQPAAHPCYRTTSSDYGRFPPSVHTVPTCYYPNNQMFSSKLAAAGMYRNYSLNTALDNKPLY